MVRIEGEQAVPFGASSIRLRFEHGGYGDRSFDQTTSQMSDEAVSLKLQHCKLFAAQCRKQVGITQLPEIQAALERIAAEYESEFERLAQIVDRQCLEDYAHNLQSRISSDPSA